MCFAWVFKNKIYKDHIKTPTMKKKKKKEKQL